MSIEIKTESKTVNRQVIERTWREELFTEYETDYSIIIHREHVTLEDGSFSKLDRSIDKDPEFNISVNGDPSLPESYEVEVVDYGHMSKLILSKSQVEGSASSVTTESGLTVPLSEVAEIIELANEHMVQAVKAARLDAAAQVAINKLIAEQSA